MFIILAFFMPFSGLLHYLPTIIFLIMGLSLFVKMVLELINKRKLSLYKPFNYMFILTILG